MVNLAPSLSAVAERSQRFFSPNTKRMEELQRDVIQRLSEVGRVLVVGGVVRDLAFFGADERPISDIDFVVTGRPRKLDLLASKLGAKKNRFGGYSLKRDGYHVDFWALHNTWAKVHQHAKITQPKDLLRATFFDWDAIVYDLTDGDVFAIPKYLDRLHRRVLDINLEATPSVHGNLVRALRRLVMWDARPGRGLRIFLDRNLDDADWKAIIESEKGAFNVTYLNQFSSTIDFKMRGLANRSHSIIGIDDRRQRSFDFCDSLPYLMKP